VCSLWLIVLLVVGFVVQFCNPDTLPSSSDSLLTVRQSLVTVKQSSITPSTSELCNSLHSSLKTSVDKATSQVKVSV